MKKILHIIGIVFGIFVFSITYVDAASASLSPSATSCYTGDTVAVTLSYYGGAWNLYVTGADNDTIVGYDLNAENTSGSKSYYVPTGAPGTYTYTLSGSITDADTDVTETINQSVTVVVNERPADPAPSTNPEPTPQPEPQQQYNPQPSPEPQNTPQQNEQEQPKEDAPEVVIEEKKEEEKIEVESISIAGFNINFNAKKEEYEIELDKGTTSLYISTKSNATSSIPDGLVDIKDKDKITITFTKGESKREYTIKFKTKISRAIDVPTGEGGSNFNLYKITTIMLAVITVLLFIMLLFSKKKVKKLKSSSATVGTVNITQNPNPVSTTVESAPVANTAPVVSNSSQVAPSSPTPQPVSTSQNQINN